MTGLTYPDISPIMFSIGPVDIRWYSMAYLAGIVLAWFLIWQNIKKYKLPLSKAMLDDLMFYITLGVIAGGRMGYVLFYGGDTFLKNPLEIFAVWHGGMSFHGGLTGVVVAVLMFAKKIKYPFLALTDLAALYAPIGLFLGRLANFANDELWGRSTDVPWAVKFPSGGYVPRHPSQLYEAFGEGVLLFIVLQLLWKNENIRKRHGLISGVFLTGYALWRIFAEFFREPDAQLGFLFSFVTMGQLLSLPILLAGILIIWFVMKKD